MYVKGLAAVLLQVIGSVACQTSRAKTAYPSIKGKVSAIILGGL